MPPAAAAFRAASPRNINQCSISDEAAPVFEPIRPTSQSIAIASSVKIGAWRPATVTRSVGRRRRKETSASWAFSDMPA